ncbi:hypothetical protein PHYBOEH_009074 [Phytophthora boehmeriae]|uniref:Uncharacterized protein n=1 Tax=Phytophthora boehmeriae TaxID=109152 RepID=A0A8T1VVS2_9STRA|nr:hypothetical protein PHYBOEH_009074 [Phytophthora boehmeriae]
MSVRREVVSLSQLLRRGDNPKARRGTTASRMPPLPLQTSARRTAPPSAAEQKRASAPFIERSSAQKSSRYQPQSLARRPRSESRLENSQPEVQTASHSRKAYMPLSQEGKSAEDTAAVGAKGKELMDLAVYDGEGEDVSVVTSLSQSSFSQPPSQNLLASSQDDQLYRLQQWQDPQDGLTQCSAPSIYTEMVQQADKHPSQVSSEQVQRQQQEQRDKERQQLHELQARERQLERQVRELQEREKGLQEQQERDRKLQEQRERDQELRQQREKELAQLREQREKELSEMRQQRLQELMTRFASPIKKSVEGMNMSLTSSTNEHKQQMATLAELSEGVNGIAVSVAELRQQVSAINVVLLATLRLTVLMAEP